MAISGRSGQNRFATILTLSVRSGANLYILGQLTYVAFFMPMNGGVNMSMGGSEI